MPPKVPVIVMARSPTVSVKHSTRTGQRAQTSRQASTLAGDSRPFERSLIQGRESFGGRTQRASVTHARRFRASLMLGTATAPRCST